MTANPFQPPDENRRTPNVPSPGRDDDQVLRYSVDIDALVAFTHFHMGGTAIMRRAKIVTAIFAMLIGGGICYALLGWATPVVRISLTLILAVLCGCLGVVFYKRGISRSTRMLYEEGDASGVFCEHELQLDEQGLGEFTAVNKSWHIYSSIPRIEDTPDYLFIYVNSMQAHVVPKENILYGNVALFQAALRQRVSNAKASE